MLIAMDLQFIGLTFVVIYLGAIIILFLFSIMLLHIKENDKKYYEQIKVSQKLFLLCFTLYIILFLFYSYIPESCLTNHCNHFAKNLSYCNYFLSIRSSEYKALDTYTSVNFHFIFLTLKLPEQMLQGFFFKVFPLNIPYFEGNKNSILRDRTELEIISKTLYNDGCFHIIFVSVILLVSLLGSVSLVSDMKKEMESQLTINQASREITFNFHN